jgi:hypothetical protein
MAAGTGSGLKPFEIRPEEIDDPVPVPEGARIEKQQK